MIVISDGQKKIILMSLNILLLFLFKVVAPFVSGGYNVTLKNVDILANQYEYIALVKIHEISNSKIHIRTIRQYKGGIKSSIKAFGNTQASKFVIAGNPSINIGDTWLIFSTERVQNKFKQFQAKILSTADKFIDRSTHSGLNIEKKLSQIFNLEKLNIHQTILNSGQTKIELPYKSGKQNGKKTFYYQNGNKYRVEKYKKGKLHGKTVEYYQNGNKAKIICYISDTIYSFRKYNSKETILTNRYEEFKSKKYPKKVNKVVLTAQDKSNDKIIRYVKQSNYKNGVIRYNYDEYFNDLSKSPKLISTEIETSIINHPKKLGQNKRKLISTNNLKIKDRNELLITYIEYEQEWSGEKRKIVFYSPSFGIFKEIHSKKTYVLNNEEGLHILINKTNEIIDKYNLHLYRHSW